MIYNDIQERASIQMELDLFFIELLPNISEEAGDPGDVGSYGSGPFISRSHRLQTCNENVIKT